jgi:hypothetical protein
MEMGVENDTQSEGQVWSTRLPNSTYKMIKFKILFTNTSTENYLITFKNKIPCNYLQQIAFRLLFLTYVQILRNGVRAEEIRFLCCSSVHTINQISPVNIHHYIIVLVGRQYSS